MYYYRTSKILIRCLEAGFEFFRADRTVRSPDYLLVLRDLLAGVRGGRNSESGIDEMASRQRIGKVEIV